MEDCKAAAVVRWSVLSFVVAIGLAVALWIHWWFWGFPADLFIVLWVALILSALAANLAVFGTCERYMRSSGRFSRAERRKWQLLAYLFGPLACIAFARKYMANDEGSDSREHAR